MKKIIKFLIVVAVLVFGAVAFSQYFKLINDFNIVYFSLEGFLLL